MIRTLNLSVLMFKSNLKFISDATTEHSFNRILRISTAANPYEKYIN